MEAELREELSELLDGTPHTDTNIDGCTSACNHCGLIEAFMIKHNMI